MKANPVIFALYRNRGDFGGLASTPSSQQKKDQATMSDYPQVFIEYADYLQLATELSGSDPLNLVASYYCRYYWAKKAGEILKQPGNMTNQVKRNNLK